jgi:hypothetical protein
LKIWLVPGIWLLSSITWTWWFVPALRGATDAAGANSEGCTSQKRVVPGIAALKRAGQAGTENAAVELLEIGGMICE